MLFDAYNSVDEIMRRYPATIAVFLRRGFGCVGCPVAPFHTVIDATAEHGADLDSFLGELLSAACAPATPPRLPTAERGDADRAP